MELHVPETYIRVTKDEFENLLSALNWHRSAYGNGERYEMNSGNQVVTIGYRLVVGETPWPEPRYWINPDLSMRFGIVPANDAPGEPVADRGVTTNELDTWFTYHKPFGSQPQRYELIRAKAFELAKQVRDWCPASHERGKAIECLRQAVMWANASIACNEHPVE